VAGDGWPAAAAEPADERLPQRRMAEGLKLTAGPGAGLDLEQSRSDPGDGSRWAGHGGPPQRACGVALVGFVILEAGADGRGCDGEHAGHSLADGAGPAGLPVGGAQCRVPGPGKARRRRPRSGASTDRKGGRSGLAGARGGTTLAAAGR
jgi:hypothetical protein